MLSTKVREKSIGKMRSMRLLAVKSTIRLRKMSVPYGDCSAACPPGRMEARIDSGSTAVAMAPTEKGMMDLSRSGHRGPV